MFPLREYMKIILNPDRKIPTVSFIIAVCHKARSCSGALKSPTAESAFMRSVRLLFTALPLLFVSGCADYNWKLPGVYRIPIQQGTVIEQSMVSRLKPGMAKDQVRFIMGSPVMVDPFHSDRWEYVYTMKEGNERVREQRHITLHFDDSEKLATVSGDIETVPAGELQGLEPRQQSETIVVPDRDKPGFFSRFFDRSPEPDLGAEPVEGGDATPDPVDSAEEVENTDVTEESEQTTEGGDTDSDN